MLLVVDPMLEPSSSEDEGDGGRCSSRPEDDVSVAELSNLGLSRQQCSDHQTNSNSSHSSQLYVSNSVPRSVSPASATSGADSQPASVRSASSDRLSLPSGRASAGARPISPCPSNSNESKEQSALDEIEQAERDEAERKFRLQLYVFVIRCITYPFNAKQPNDMTRRHLKVQKGQLEQMVVRFGAFLKGDLQIASDEAFQNAIQHYSEVFLNSDRIQLMVNGGACSTYDFKEIFRISIEKRIRSLPEIDGLSKETMLSSWMTKFEGLLRGDEETKTKAISRVQQQQQNLAAELILSKEQLYDMFQGVLNIKKFEHQLLFNALQVKTKEKHKAEYRREGR